MQNVMQESLPKSQRANEEMRIFKERSSLEEMLMATYSKAIDSIRLYEKKRFPMPPKGYHDAMNDYHLLSVENKSKAWKVILDRFKDFIAVLDSTKAENASNLKFLREMEQFFAEHNMPMQKETVLQAIYTHES